VVSLPRRIAQDAPEAERRRWRIVRLDTLTQLPGLILSADADTGVATMKGKDNQVHDYSLGPGGLVIVGH
jgi:hypothetical protein